MSAQSLLEQLLKSGLSMMQGATTPPGANLPSAPRGQAPAAYPGARPGMPPMGQPGGPAPGAPRRDDGFAWGTFGAGAASGGALAMLLGHKRARGYAGKALKVGSVAALGALAFKAYSAWQAQQAQQAAGAAAPPATANGPTGWAGSPAAGGFGAATAPRMVDALPAPEVEQHSHAMLKAMVAAAKADGHLDDRERGLVEAELQRLDDDGALRRWLEAELRRPLDPADVAAAARTPEMAAEMYLASVLVCDDTNTMERLYLQELARELKLPPGLKSQLEVQAAAA
jgi:uncharacterized membrane protein YebE (DUF533 family)